MKAKILNTKILLFCNRVSNLQALLLPFQHKCSIFVFVKRMTECSKIYSQAFNKLLLPLSENNCEENHIWLQLPHTNFTPGSNVSLSHRYNIYANNAKIAREFHRALQTDGNVLKEIKGKLPTCQKCLVQHIKWFKNLKSSCLPFL